MYLHQIENTVIITGFEIADFKQTLAARTGIEPVHRP